MNDLGSGLLYLPGLTCKAVYRPKIALCQKTARGCVATGTGEKMKHDPGGLV